MIWVRERLEYARRFRLSGTRALETPLDPFVEVCFRVLAREMEKMGLDVDPRDMIWQVDESQDPVKARFLPSYLFRWSPQGRPVELYGGPRDGAILTDFGRVAGEETVRVPTLMVDHRPLDPADRAALWLSSAMAVATYRLAGWNTATRAWIYTYDSQEHDL